MSQTVVTHPRAEAPATAERPATKAEQIAAGLRRISETLIAPRLRITAILGDGLRPVVRMIASSDPVRREWFLRDGTRGDMNRDQVRRDLMAIPPLTVLQPLQEFALKAFGEPSNRKQNRLLIGLMVDSYPNARPHSPETYFEALAHQLNESGYAPVAVACALREIVRRKTFAPSIAEVMEACENETASQRYDAKSLATAIQAREWLEDAAALVAAYEAGERWTPPAEPAREPWKEGDPIPF